MGGARPTPEPSPEPVPGSRLKRLALLAASTLVAVNIWTGAPLMALWVGSRMVGRRAVTMGSVLLIVVLLAVFVTAMAMALTWLSARYDELTQRPEGERLISPWVRSMRGEDDEVARARAGTTPVELIVTASTVVAVICLEVWFFFFAGSPLPS
ncbi:MAG TPA: hypothetical protein VGN08_02710 [Solirubrobacteraceae bacterium]